MGLFDKIFKKFYYYLTVYFIDDKSKKQYYYISEDQSIKTNDFVVVEVSGEFKICKVVQTCIYSSNQAPYPVEQTKTIISKFDKQSLEELLEESEIPSSSEEKSDYGFYKAKTFFSNGFINEGTNALMINNNKIIFVKPGYCNYRELSLTLPDNLEYADLKMRVTEEGDYGHTYQVDRPFPLKKLIIPFGYKKVDLSYVDDLSELYISNGVEEITIDPSLSKTVKALYIPKDLERIKIITKRKYDTCWSTDKNILFQLFNFEKIFVDKENKHFILENGVLYHVENNQKTILWASKNVKNITIDETTKNILVNRQDIVLTIKNKNFFEDLKKNLFFDSDILYWTKKIFDDKIYKCFLEIYKQIIVTNYEDFNENYYFNNVTFESSTKIFKGINAKDIFFKNNSWYVNGCQTIDELNFLMTCIRWELQTINGNYKTVVIDKIAEQKEFLKYYKKRNGYEIHSLVDLVGRDYMLDGIPTYEVKEIIEFKNNLINKEYYEEENAKKIETTMTKEEIEEIENQINLIKEGLTHILGFRNFNLNFKNKKDKILFIKIFDTFFSFVGNFNTGGTELRIHNTPIHFYNDPEGAFSYSNLLPDNRTPLPITRATKLIYREDDNLVQVRFSANESEMKNYLEYLKEYDF